MIELRKKKKKARIDDGQILQLKIERIKKMREKLGVKEKGKNVNSVCLLTLLQA